MSKAFVMVLLVAFIEILSLYKKKMKIDLSNNCLTGIVSLHLPPYQFISSASQVKESMHGSKNGDSITVFGRYFQFVLFFHVLSHSPHFELILVEISIEFVYFMLVSLHKHG